MTFRHNPSTHRNVLTTLPKLCSSRTEAPAHINRDGPRDGVGIVAQQPPAQVVPVLPAAGQTVAEPNRAAQLARVRPGRGLDAGRFDRAGKLEPQEGPSECIYEAGGDARPRHERWHRLSALQPAAGRRYPVPAGPRCQCLPSVQPTVAGGRAAAVSTGAWRMFGSLTLTITVLMPDLLTIFRLYVG